MRALTLVLFIMSCALLDAQEVVATAGSTLKNENGSISFTMGESVANTLIKGDKAITQGFQQANMTVSTISEQKDLDFSISAFPNPTVNLLTLKLDRKDVSGLHYELFDTNGRLLFQKKIGSNETSISFDQLPKGMYVLKVMEGLNELKTFKIIKL